MNNVVKFKDEDETETFTGSVIIKVVDNGFIVEYTGDDENLTTYKTAVYSYKNGEQMIRELAEELGIEKL